MVDIATNTIVKNGEEYIEECLLAILPYIAVAHVAVDLRSSDDTMRIVSKLSKWFPNLKVSRYFVVDYKKGLTDVRNKQLKETKNKWIWIVDDDEYYPQSSIVKILKDIEEFDADSYELKFWHLYNKWRYHIRRSNIYTVRVFKNNPQVLWGGLFGKERLYRSGRLLSEFSHQLNERYIHFSMLKKHSWRVDFNKPYTIDGKHNLRDLPQDILSEVNQIYEAKAMQDV